jgi:hypothetical protein
LQAGVAPQSLGLFDKLQPSQVCLGPTGPDQQIAQHVRWQRRIGAMMVHDDPTAIPVTVDSLAWLPCRFVELKPSPGLRSLD